MNHIMRKLGVGVTALSIVLTGASYSNAALFGVDVDAEFGLDQKTMDFINGLAPQVRQEVVKLLKEALPLIDSSVTAYLDKVDGILEKQINHMQCAAIGAGAALSDDLKGKTFGGPPQPVSKLEEDMKKTITGFKPDVNPHDMRLAYSDLIYRATVTSCQVSIAPETEKDVAAILENVRPRWMVWYRLDGSCPDITQCYSWQEQHTKETISKADKRDVASIDGETRMSAVHQPNTRASGVAWWKTFNPTEHEKALGELISLEDGIKLAAAKRLTDAKSALESAGYLITEAKTVFANSPHGPFPIVPDCNIPRIAKDRAQLAMQDADEIRTALAKAVELDPTLTPRVQQSRAEFETTMHMASAQIAMAREARRLDFGFHGNFPAPRIRSCNL